MIPFIEPQRLWGWYPSSELTFQAAWILLRHGVRTMPLLLCSNLKSELLKLLQYALENGLDPNFKRSRNICNS